MLFRSKASGVAIYLRYASEMNGTWTQYSGKEKLYKEKWKLVHDVMEKEAPNVIMTWTVFTFPESRIDMFYPGDAYVDCVGVNIYNVVYHNNRLTDDGTKEDPLKLLDYVYNTYSYRKPIQISEFGVTHYTVTDKKTYVDFANERITRMYKQLEERYPRVKSIFYFDVNTMNSCYPDRRINDYSLTTNAAVLANYKKIISNDYYISTPSAIKMQGTWDEVFTFNSNYKVVNGKIYIDVDFIKNYLGIPVKSQSGNKITFSKGGKTSTFTTQKHKVSNGFDGDRKSVA